MEGATTSFLLFTVKLGVPGFDLAKVPDWERSFKRKAHTSLHQRNLKHHVFEIFVRDIV